MKTKTKLNLAVGLLLSLILLLSILSAYFIFEIKKDTDNILTANYHTLQYSREMLKSLDKVEGGHAEALPEFGRQLEKQVQNITEEGEASATNALKNHFNQLSLQPANVALIREIRDDIFGIMELNLNAIKVKSDQAKQTAATANLIIAFAGTLCFLIAFNLMVNLPENIANPIRELTRSIGEIAKGNYRQRVNFRNRNEFGDLARSFNTMAEKLQEYDESNLNRLLVEKKRFETLLSNMRDPVIGRDESGRIVSINEEALGILGMKPETLLGKTTSEAAQTSDLLRSLFSNETPQKEVAIFAHGKQSYFEPERQEIQIVPTGETEAVSSGSFLILRNVTSFRELDLAKTNFIATVSHELKTPVSAIKLSLNLLENDRGNVLNDDQIQLVSGIREDSDRLLKITAELLEMSQLETGKIQLSIGRCATAEIVDLALSAVKAAADQKQIRFEVLLPDSSISIRSDKDKTSWVLINFLTNAIRYSPEADLVTIKIEEKGDQVTFSVADKGKGIDKRYQARIFDRYFQVPETRKSGTGLGLAISREFIEAQSGQIGVESSLGMGSRFWFSLPKA